MPLSHKSILLTFTSTAIYCMLCFVESSSDVKIDISEKRPLLINE